MKKTLALLAFLLIPLVAHARSTVFPVPTAVSVTTSSTAVFSEKRGRSLLILINDSDTVIYCSIDGTDAALNDSIRLNASGGVAFFDVAVPEAAVACIHGGTGSKTILGIEG